MTYKEKKERARQKAIDWSYEIVDRVMSWANIAEETAYFEKLGLRFGLTKEFRENGII